ncbi:MAG: hypothetical protein RLZZ464_2145 [Pseudomonadota bacterium]|jgi:uncharacterized protein with HEPN domain
MSKALRVPDYLGHILQAMERIERYTLQMDEAHFYASEMIQDAVIRNFEVIGEAANNIQRVDPSFAAAHSDIPWQVMYTMRNRLTHGYDKVDLAIVWQSIRRDLPELYTRIKSALD